MPDVQLSFEDSLAAQLVFDVREQVGALPLLQFTLDQLFQRRQGHLLTEAAYHNMGGVRGALRAHADAIYKGLNTDTHRALAQALFLKLVEPGTAEKDATRRRAHPDEFNLSDPAQQQIMSEVIAAFVDGRLLTTEKDSIEVSHEALLREWQFLVGWIGQNRQDIIFGSQLTNAAKEWTGKGAQPDDDGLLYRSTRLLDAQAWSTRNLTGAQVEAFIATSAAREQFLKAEEEKRPSYTASRFRPMVARRHLLGPTVRCDCGSFQHR